MKAKAIMSPGRVHKSSSAASGPQRPKDRCVLRQSATMPRNPTETASRSPARSSDPAQSAICSLGIQPVFVQVTEGHRPGETPQTFGEHEEQLPSRTQPVQGEGEKAWGIGGKVDRMHRDDRIEGLGQSVRICDLGFDQLVDSGRDHARDRDLRMASAEKVPVSLKAVLHRILRYEAKRL